MIPVLYEPTETSFTTYGIGALSDAISPHVVEERNGEYTLEMQYPVDGVNYDGIQLRGIIKALPSPDKTPQPFRIFRISKPINGIVTVYARHIRYDLEGVPVLPFTANSLYNSLRSIEQNAMVTNPFRFYTDKTSSVGMKSEIPTSTLSLMGGQEGSLLDIYGGEYDYDGTDIWLYASRGRSTDVVIRYGIDLIDLEQEENCSNVYTGVMAFWKSSQDNTTVSGDVQSVGTFDFTRIKVIDRSMNYEGTPTVAQLNNDAIAYINESKCGVPKVSITLKFQQADELGLTGNKLKLCDLVTVKFEKLGVSAKAKIIRTDFDVVNERYISLEIGDSRTSMAETILGISTRAESAPTATEMQQAITATTAAITGANGGAVRLLDTDNDGKPDTLYIADNEDPLLASKVWRFNYEGWGASQNGYSGPYTMGATFLQGFIADFITAGTLSADRIAANSLNVSKLSGTIANGNWAIDFDNGTLSIGEISANKITSGTLDASNITVTNLSADSITAGTISAARIEDRSLSGTKLEVGAVSNTEIANLTISGSKLQNYTLSDLQMVSGGLSTWSTSGGINTSLGYADFSHDVFFSGDEADYLNAKYITVSRSITANDYYVRIDSETQGRVGHHTHYVTVNGNTVTLGDPDFTGAPHPFEVAGAATVESTVISGTPTYQTANKRFAVPVLVTLSNGNTSSTTLYVNANEAYTAGANSVDVSWSDGDYDIWIYPYYYDSWEEINGGLAHAKLTNGKERTVRLQW